MLAEIETGGLLVAVVLVLAIIALLFFIIPKIRG